MFKIKTDNQSISESSGASFIGSSGIYDVTINFASVAVTANGAEQMVFNVDYNGNGQTFYGPYYKDTKGNYLDIGVKLYTTLGVISGLEDGDEFTIESESHEVGKDKESKEFDVVQELTDLNIKLQVQAEYSIYKDNIQERMAIRSFFREDGASAEEIVNDGDTGKRLAMVEEKYASNISYRDGLTPEAVEEWVKAGRGKGGASGTPTPKKSAGAKTGSLFKKKQ